MKKRNYGLQKLIIIGILIISIPMAMALIFSAYTSRATINRSMKAADFSALVSTYYDMTKQLKKNATNYFVTLSEDDLKKYQDESEAIEALLDGYDTGGFIDADRKISKMRSMQRYLHKPMELYDQGVISRENLLESYGYRYAVVISSKELSYDAVARHTIAQMEKAKEIRKTTNELLILSTLISVAMIVISYIYSKIIIINPIVNLEESVKSFGNNGGYLISPVKGYSREIDSLSQSFADMAERVNHTLAAISENARLQEENLIAQNNISKLKFRNLQAQINPHFLFNTLSLISNTALSNGDNESYELMQRMTKFLRYAMDNLVTTSTIGNEIDAIENYLFIQKKRFGDRIIFSLDYDPEFSEIEIPAITLQPLIENSISHGMTVDRPITIRVFIEKEDQLLVLGVEDDGTGMDASTIENLYESLSQDYINGISKSATIGLSNVYGRYKSMFGNQLQFYIESDLDCGTVITIKIPFLG